ncbi:Uncharacterised protein [Acinetobacter baumannii]|nr:Uncharacterised protein [Acinetobacter baumannii]
MVTIYNILIDASTAFNVIRLHCKHFLECICCTVCFKCPHFHLTETLTTELCFTTKRLLCNK